MAGPWIREGLEPPCLFDGHDVYCRLIACPNWTRPISGDIWQDMLEPYNSNVDTLEWAAYLDHIGLVHSRQWCPAIQRRVCFHEFGLSDTRYPLGLPPIRITTLQAFRHWQLGCLCSTCCPLYRPSQFQNDGEALSEIFRCLTPDLQIDNRPHLDWDPSAGYEDDYAWAINGAWTHQVNGGQYTSSLGYVVGIPFVWTLPHRDPAVRVNGFAVRDNQGTVSNFPARTAYWEEN